MDSLSPPTTPCRGLPSGQDTPANSKWRGAGEGRCPQLLVLVRLGRMFTADNKYFLRVSVTLVFRDPPALVARILTKELKGHGREKVEK